MQILNIYVLLLSHNIICLYIIVKHYKDLTFIILHINMIIIAIKIIFIYYKNSFLILLYTLLM